MADLDPGDRRPAKPLVKRLDRWAGEINAFLMVLALGLAVLDATCFAALHLNDGATTGMYGGPATHAAKIAAIAR